MARSTPQQQLLLLAPQQLLLFSLALGVLCLAAPAAAYTYTSWHECSAQAVYGGIYGAEVLGNLSDFKSGLLSHVWKSFDPTVPYAEVSEFRGCLVITVAVVQAMHSPLCQTHHSSCRQLVSNALRHPLVACAHARVSLSSGGGVPQSAPCMQAHYQQQQRGSRPTAHTATPIPFPPCLIDCAVQGFKRFDPVRPFIHCPPHQPLIRYGNAAGVCGVCYGCSYVSCTSSRNRRMNSLAGNPV